MEISLKTLSQDVRSLQTNMDRAFAMLTAQNFLLEQLYGQWFLADTGARSNVPTKLIGATRFAAHSPDTSAEAFEIQRLAIQHMEKFFASVKQRVEETEWALSRQSDTK